MSENPELPTGNWEREPDPSQSLKVFGAVLHALRDYAGYEKDEFAAIIRYSPHTLESIELGRRWPDEVLIERSEEATGNTGALRKAAPHLTRGEPGIATWFRRWARLEKSAVSLDTYENRLVPGLLQTEGYARAVFENGLPPLTDEQVEDLVKARLKRQRMLHERPNAPFSFIVEEAAFLRRIGSTEVRRELIDHVLKCGAMRNVTLQVMPLEAEFHACLDGPVQLMETPNGKRYAYSEGQQNGRLISDRKELVLLKQRYDTLRSQALNPKETQVLLERIRGAL